MIETARLRLIPATTALVAAEIAGKESLADALGANVPANWPPDLLVDALLFFQEQLWRQPNLAGWLSWYWLSRGTGETVIGSGGFKGAPGPDGVVEIGYSVLPQFRGRGLATEAVGALVKWAFRTTEVACVIAETAPENAASVQVLAKLGFLRVGAGLEPGTVRWVLLSANEPVDSGLDVS